MNIDRPLTVIHPLSNDRILRLSIELLSIRNVGRLLVIAQAILNIREFILKNSYSMNLIKSFDTIDFSLHIRDF